MKVLHLTSWYPSPEFPYVDYFVKEHIDCLNLVSESVCIHIQVQKGEKLLPKFSHRVYSDYEESITAKTSTNKWKLIELLTLFLILYARIKKSSLFHQCDVINFHVAYPLLRFTKLLKWILKKPIVITEHWTAYENNFNISRTKARPIARIFANQIPLITVSDYLASQIRRFSGIMDLPYEKVPNVVDEKIFNLRKTGAMPIVDESFFMVNNWRSIKKPMVLLQAFERYLQVKPNALLRVGGFGEQYDDMISFVQSRNLQGSIILLGKLTKSQIAIELSVSTAFLHPTSQETFSVVVAEALACGVPAISSDLPVLRELINEENGILVESNSEDDWYNALLEFDRGKYESEKISHLAIAKFSQKAVANLYFKVLSKSIEVHS